MAAEAEARASTGAAAAASTAHGVTCEPLLYLDRPAQQAAALGKRGEARRSPQPARAVFDIVSGGTQARCRERPRALRALSSNGGIVVVGGFDKKATLHHVSAGAYLSHFPCANDIVRSVHLSADSSLMAIGSDKQGKGYVCVYDTNAQKLHAEWPHPKAVWCVRLSPDGRTLAAAGYDMKMTVYDTESRAQVHELSYTSKIGPAFIWSMAFSHDSRSLALGCWSGFAHL